MAGTRVTKRREKPVLGWREWISLPELGLKVKAKVDTGARSSALHAYDIEYFKRRGETWVRFRVHPVQRDSSITVLAEAPLVDEKIVRPSSGHAEHRPVIRTLLQLGDGAWPIEITLAQRDVMGFRMLLGRQSIKGRHLVDPGRSFVVSTDPYRALANRTPRKKKKKGSRRA